jgi:hypothetical protein
MYLLPGVTVHKHNIKYGQNDLTFTLLKFSQHFSIYSKSSNSFSTITSTNDDEASCYNLEYIIPFQCFYIKCESTNNASATTP